MAWSVGDGRPGVPNHQLLIISNRAKQGLMQQMPCNVLHNSSMAWRLSSYKIRTRFSPTTCENCLSVDNLVLLRGGVNVPQANSVVIGRRKEVTIQIRVPGQTVSFLLVPPELEVRVTLATGVRLTRVLGVVEHKHV